MEEGNTSSSLYNIFHYSVAGYFRLPLALMGKNERTVSLTMLRKWGYVTIVRSPNGDTVNAYI